MLWEIRTADSFTQSAARCAYHSVVCTSECPSRRPIMGGSGRAPATRRCVSYSGFGISGIIPGSVLFRIGPSVDAGNRRYFSTLRRIAMVDIPE